MTSNVGWTAQSSHGWVHDEGMPGQTFTEDQLPHPDVQRASGIDPRQYRRQHGLWVEPAEGPMPEFVGTETGHSPKDSISETGHVQSFQSYFPEVPEEQLTKVTPKKAPKSAKKITEVA